MYCTHCGKSIQNNSKFCPYCGGKAVTFNESNNITETIKKGASATVNTAKDIGSSINEATNGQAQKYAEKAKETANNKRKQRRS